MDTSARHTELPDTYTTPMSMLPFRNKKGLSPDEISRCQTLWKVLLDAQDAKHGVNVALDASRAAIDYTATAYACDTNTVKLGANVKPGIETDPNSRLSITACLAHELAHAQRYALGYARPFDPAPDSHLDEAETSIAAAFMVPLLPSDREDLIDDARHHLSHWLQIKRFCP